MNKLPCPRRRSGEVIEYDSLTSPTGPSRRSRDWSFTKRHARRCARNFYAAWTAGIVGRDSGAEFTNFELAQLLQRAAASSQYAIVQVGLPPKCAGGNAGMSRFLLFVMLERRRGAARTPFGPWVTSLSGLPA